MNTSESLNKAYQIIAELINEECFDFSVVVNSSFEERKEYLRDMIGKYFCSGETNLAGVIKRVDSDDYVYEGLGITPETIENISEFFNNELLVADTILLMDEELFYEYEKI